MTNVEQQIATSVLVIGTGGSGLRAAIELAERGIGVLIVGKRPKTDAHTTLAAGGINAALATMDADDTWQQHAADTLTESYLLADPVTVQVVTEGAAESIRDLERWGMVFAREQDGRISQRFFGAHTFRRTAFAGDYTGLELQRTLIRRASQLAFRPRLTHQAARPRECHLRCLRLQPSGRHPLHHPLRCRHPRYRWTHSDLATYIVASRRKHR
jgi:succinate dehydrogenase / fumarate reductase flavoprotein subunit